MTGPPGPPRVLGNLTETLCFEQIGLRAPRERPSSVRPVREGVSRASGSGSGTENGAEIESQIGPRPKVEPKSTRTYVSNSKITTGRPESGDLSENAVMYRAILEKA